MFDNFTDRAAKVFIEAQNEARFMGHPYVGTEHLLLGLLKVGGKYLSQIFSYYNLTYGKIKSEITNIVGVNASHNIVGSSPQPTPRAKRIIELAYDESEILGTSQIDAEHLLLGICREGEGIAAHVLRRLGLNLVEMRKKLADLMLNKSESINSESSSFEEDNEEKIRQRQNAIKQLEGYGTDLTAKAANGELDPVIGREVEIRRLMEILARRKKNNPVLIGEAGVGKSAIVEGLAEKIVKGDVPEVLKNKCIFSLDLTSLVAGTKYRGEFEKRMKKLMQILEKNKDILLFIDELHMIVEAITVIGATTPSEYRKFIEKDPALERRFQKIYVNEPTYEEALDILKGIKLKYEEHHKVKYTNEALEAAVNLSLRYITDRFLPDKAVDLIDEAGARIRLSALTLPKNLKNMLNKITELENKKEYLMQQDKYDEIEELKNEISRLKKKYSKKYAEWRKKAEKEVIEITDEHISEVVSDWTGVPLKKLEMSEMERLLNLEAVLHERVIGQEEAIKAVSKAIRRARSGIKDPRRPTGVFLFLGPTGVGKTELAKTIAEYLFGDEKALIRIDMSEYMEKFNVSRLVGAPPGYVGYEEGGQLTETVRRRPYSVILLDEIEKAHPDVYNILLQIMDDGRLTDSQGRVVDFRNAIIVMTSNLGSSVINRTKRSMGFVDEESEEKKYNEIKLSVMEEVRKAFKPEFLNRLDETVVFHPLTKNDMKEIIKIQLNDLEKRLKEKDLHLKFKEEAIELLVDKGFDPIFGARPLKRAIQKYLEDPLSEEILKGRFREGDKIIIDIKDNKIHFKKGRRKNPKQKVL
ncbi:MAG: ATP-dependent Clp protease ATP-binding subunit ClpC [Marinitoga sp. 4572_148]|nr:MAG: ATP-dependent Clp protease ATP-binding subunit ClpC [Marinitoga sp. 4572_148]